MSYYNPAYYGREFMRVSHASMLIASNVGDTNIVTFVDTKNGAPKRSPARKV